MMEKSLEQGHGGCRGSEAARLEVSEAQQESRGWEEQQRKHRLWSQRGPQRLRGDAWGLC